MKKTGLLARLTLAACTALMAPSPAQAQDVEACRGGYSVMLMTRTECTTYLKQLKDAQIRADKTAELELREWHTQLLIDRAETCPCQHDQNKTLAIRTVSAQ
ncbi:MAG: hypothetical protein ABL892_11850 [Thiobacillaceae bacterium]